MAQSHHSIIVSLAFNQEVMFCELQLSWLSAFIYH